MLGHVAQSVGGALPGLSTSLFPIVGQSQFISRGTSSATTTDAVSIPAEAAWAFAEALGCGGAAGASNAYYSAGAAGADAIIAVNPSSTLMAILPEAQSTADAVIQLDGTAVVTAASIKATSTSSSQAGASGKYSGGSASGAPGKGGGRLAGASTIAAGGAAGYGSGRRGSSATQQGGFAVACITFFRTREDAVAFANLYYGGNWQP